MGGEAAEVLAAIFGDAFNVDALADNDNFVTAGQRLAEAHMVLLCQDGWEGVVEIVGEGESGRQVPIELTLGSIALLLDDPACRALVLKVVNASIHEALAEKNGSSASPDGAGEAGERYCAACRSSGEPCAIGRPRPQRKTLPGARERAADTGRARGRGRA